MATRPHEQILEECDARFRNHHIASDTAWAVSQGTVDRRVAFKPRYMYGYSYETVYAWVLSDANVEERANAVRSAYELGGHDAVSKLLGRP